MTAEIEMVRQLADLGYPFVVLLFVFAGLRKLWGDLWPWWTNTYWPAREARLAARDEAYQTITGQFIGALKEYQNGFRTQTTLEHQQIVKQVQQIGESVGRAMAEIVEQLRRQSK